MKKVKRKQIDFGGTSDQIVRGDGELGEYENSFIINLTASYNQDDGIISHFTCNRTAKDINIAIKNHQTLKCYVIIDGFTEKVFCYIDSIEQNNTTRGNQTLDSVVLFIHWISLLSNNCFKLKLNANYIINNNTQQVIQNNVVISGGALDYPFRAQSDWNQTNSTKIDFIKNKPLLPTFRTLNNEPIVDDTLGDANLHDGFYFPNAVQDPDGNWYGAVVIGNQVWLGENLKTTQYSLSTPVAIANGGENNSLDTPYYYNDNTINQHTDRCYLYNWAAINGHSQSISPDQTSLDFWVPTKQQYEELLSYVTNQIRYRYKNIETISIIKSLCNKRDKWKKSSNPQGCPGSTGEYNQTGFGLCPIGYRLDNGTQNDKEFAYLWTATEGEGDYAKAIKVSYNGLEAEFVDELKSSAFAIRCVSSLTPIEFRNTYIALYGSLQHHIPEEVQVQTDWNQQDNTKIDYIKNKPTSVNDLDLYTITISIPSSNSTEYSCNRTPKEIVDNVYVGNKIPVFFLDIQTEGQLIQLQQGRANVDIVGTSTMEYYGQYELYYLRQPSTQLPKLYTLNLEVDYTEDESFNELLFSGGESDIQADWNETNSGFLSYIKNKPTSISDLDLYLITITESENSGVYSYTCDKTAKEIIENIYDNGKTPVYLFSGRAFQNLGKVVLSQSSAAKSSNDSYKLYTCDLHLINKQGSTNRFLKLTLTTRHYSDDETNDTLDIVGTYDDLAADWNESDTTSFAYIKNKPDIDKIFYCSVVTRDNQTNEVTINKTVTEINDAITAGKVVLLKDGDAIYQLNWRNQDPIFVNIFGLYIYIISYNHFNQKWQFSTTQIASSGSVNDGVLTIQKNGTTIDTFSANAASNKTINITVPTQASDVSALPASTKYATALSLSINSSTYVVTAQLKDQDGNNIGSAQTIDLPLESVVVNGSYDSTNKKVVLTLESGSTVEFSVADLVSGLQPELSASNKLNADYVEDGTTNKVFTATEKTKLSGIETGAEVNVQSDWNQTDNSSDDFIKNKPSILQTKGNSVTDTMSQQAISELVDNTIRSLQEEIHYYHGYPTAFVIDQRGTNTDPDTMVSANLIVNNQNLEAAKAGTLKASTILDNSNVISASGSVGSESVNTITWLRKHSHVFVGKWDGTVMKLRQLSDNDKTKFVDGEDATNYITGAAAGDGITYDVWMKLPCDIYYKGFPLIPDNDTVPSQDLQLIVISKEIPSDPENWEKWDANKLIGDYKAYVTGTTTYSLSGKIPSNNINQTNSKTYAGNRGTGFKLVDLQANSIMALLFYGYYSTLHSQGVCGSGTVNTVENVYYPKKAGLCNNLGMTDTTTITGNGSGSPAAADIQSGEGTGIVSINFWGIENWWGDIYEWMDDLQVMQARRPSSVATANPSLYVDDYINNYITNHSGATGAIICIDGVDTLVTPTDIANTSTYAEDDRFISIRDINGNIIRVLNSRLKTQEGNIAKVSLGDHGDVFPKALGGNYNVNSYCDYGGVYSVGSVALRSARAASSHGGVACLHLYYGAVHSSSHIGFRLLYEGDSTNTTVVAEGDTW